MERTVPNTGSEEIELYMRTYYSLLRTTDEVQIQSLVETHQGMDSLLHIKAGEEALDVSAFIYSSLRLPTCIRQTRLVVMGQSEGVFDQRGFPHVERWQSVSARGRRRRVFFDGEETLAVYIASVSDIDDLVPILTAFQIEWNKMHFRLRSSSVFADLETCVAQERPLNDYTCSLVAETLGIYQDELAQLREIWGDEFISLMYDIGRGRKLMAIRTLNSSWSEYRRATQRWWEDIVAHAPVDLDERPVYFISSNTHSVTNMLSGFALRRADELIQYLHDCGDSELQAEYLDIQAREVPSSRENFLYYMLKKYLDAPAGKTAWDERHAAEVASGITHVESHHVFDVAAQVIELRSLRCDWLDPRLRIPEIECINQSDAIILNIDYPLGMGAYHILSQITSRVENFAGVYILGKAASLNGSVGDIMIPNVVHDEHSQNTYLFNNLFTAGHVRPHLVYGTVLDNQKAITVRGTFLQNQRYMGVFYREGYTDIEMEAGPYLSAVYEALRPRRYPFDEIVNLYPVPFDVGIIHYVSDTPISEGQNLGAQNLSYFGMDPTYAGTVAILHRILSQECASRNGRYQKPALL